MSHGGVLSRAAKRAVSDPVGFGRLLWPLLRYETMPLYIRAVELLPPRAGDAVHRLIHALSRSLRLVPLLRGPASVAFAASAWGLGKREQALRITRREGYRSPRLLAGLAVLLLRAGELEEAWQLVAQMPRGGPYTAGVRGRVLAARGDLSQACEELESALRRWRGHRGWQTELERARGELTAMDPSWIPRLTSDSHIGRPGHVLHVLTNSLPYRQNGYTVRSHQIVRAQRALGLSPALVTRAGFPANEGIFGAELTESVEGIPYFHPEAGDLLRPPMDAAIERNARHALQIARRTDAAVLHPTSDYPNALAALVVREAIGTPVVYEVRGFLEESWLTRAGVAGIESERYVGRRATETRCMQEADAVVTIADVMKRLIVDRGVNEEKIVVVPNAVDPDVFHPVADRSAALRRRLRLDDSEVVVGYISSLVAYEGTDTLIAACAKLRNKGRSVKCLIVGDGPERPRLQQQSYELGVADVVVFTGKVPHTDINDYYNAMDIFVVPRRSDPVCHLVTPLKPFEAMAAERALVVSELPPLLEVIDGGSCGISFRPEDPLELAHVVESLMDDPVRRRDLGVAARAFVEENRTWHRNAERYRELYERLGAA